MVKASGIFDQNKCNSEPKLRSNEKFTNDSVPLCNDNYGRAATW